MKIEKYISALMFRYQCVIVPSFGAFLSENHSAYYDEKANAFYPPHKRLSFNINLIYNDGLLAQHVAAMENISYNDALVAIKKQVQVWKDSLEKTNKVFLPQIGEFHKMEENNIVFYPCGSSTFIKTSFGLSAVEAPILVRDTPIITTVKSTNSKRALIRFIPYAASVAILIGVSSFIIPNAVDSYKEHQLLRVQKSVQNQLETKIQQATFFIEPNLNTISIPVIEKKDKTIPTPYYIVASAFRNLDGAKSEAEKLKKSGYTDAIVLDKNKFGMFPVSYGGYENKDIAQKELRKIHRNLNKDAWILLQ
ncbi:HU domain-containing protein [Myroides sp. LJL115]